MRALQAVVAALAGLVLGAVAMLGMQGAPAAPSGAPRGGPGEAPGAAPGASGSGPGATDGGAVPATVPEPTGAVVLVWTPGGLPAGLADAVAALPRVEAVTVVRGGLIELTRSVDASGQAVDVLPDGVVVPLDAMAFDPATYPPLLPKGAGAQVARLAAGEALLGATGAALRGVDVGGRLHLVDGTTLTVTGVVDDVLVGAAEVAVASPGLPALPERYLLVRHAGDRAALEAAVRAAAPPGTPLRIRGPGETPYFRHGDAVLPQAVVKQRFGEFAYRRTAQREVVQDPAWVAEHIVTEPVPVLGRVTCHRALLPALRGALAELERDGLGWLVDPAGFAGCHSARLTSSLDSVSRHAWGIAVDLNQHKNPHGHTGVQDPRLLAAFERWGFTWGGEWLVPDPAHLEYARP